MTEKSGELYVKALTISPGHPQASLKLALLALRAGQVQEARARLEDVLKYNPGHLETLMQLASFEFRLDNIEKAKAWVEKAVEIHPQARLPNITLASYYLRVGEPSAAVELFPV